MELPTPITSNFKTSYLSKTTPTYENSFRTGTTVNVDGKLGDGIDEYPDGEGSETSTESSIKNDTTVKADERIGDVIDGYPDAKGNENSLENSVKTGTKLFLEEKESDGIDKYQDDEGSETPTENSMKTGTTIKADGRIGDVIDGYPDAKGRENTSKETINNKLLTHSVRKNTRLIQKGMDNGKGVPYTDYVSRSRGPGFAHEAGKICTHEKKNGNFVYDLTCL